MNPRAFFVLLLLSAVAAAAPSGALPEHPDAIQYPPLDFVPPDPAAHRVVRSGVENPIVYFVRDDSLPIVSASVFVTAGTAEGPVAEMALSLLVRGGTGDESGPELRERIESMGGNIEVDAGREWSEVRIGVLSADLPAALDALADVIHRPAFRADEIARWREERRLEWARRNDSVRNVTNRTFRKLALGADHPFARENPPEAFAEIDGKALAAYMASVRTRPMVVTVAGRIEDVAAATERIFAKFPASAATAARPAASAPPTPEKRVVHFVDRPGATQANVLIGGTTLPAAGFADRIALELANYILGGGGFPSRITKRVRSDEGLAYSAGSRIEAGEWRHGIATIGFQSRSGMTPFAIRIALDELARLRNEGPTPEELAWAKGALVERHPDEFDTPESIARVFAELSITGKPLDWHATWASRVNATTLAEVHAAARKHLPDPERAVILVVGDPETVLPGDPTGVRPERLEHFGEVRRLPAE